MRAPKSSTASDTRQPRAEVDSSSSASSSNPGSHDKSNPDIGSFRRSSLVGEQPPLRLLVVDEDTPLRSAFSEVGASLGFLVDETGNTEAARQVLAGRQTDILLLDVTRIESGGQSLFEEMKAHYPETVVIVMTASATIASAVETMRIGASDYLSKPFPLHVLTQSLERAAKRWHFDVEHREFQREKGRRISDLLGRSTEMEKLYRFLSNVADSNHPVMIVGESGTGKPLVAKSIHSNSANAAKPFVSLDCKMLGPTLLERELFGHVKGAWSEAPTPKRGLLASPHGGTLFLDEIGDMPLELQGKLMTALKEKEIRPIGGTKEVPVSVRILAATNRDLSQMVRAGEFRMDLYQLLSVVNLHIPPLRGRPDDIAFLAKRFLEKIQHRTGIKRTLSQETLRLLETYDWPNNVRELEQSLDRACSDSSGPELQAIHLPQNLLSFHRKRESGGIVPIPVMETRAIQEALRHANGDKIKAARLLGISKSTLYRRLKRPGHIDTAKTAVPSGSRKFIA